ncbi:MAG: FHIPEP family type III secretion protein, partial [Rubrivivax sp.]
MSTARLSSSPWLTRIQGLLGPDAGILKALTAPLFIVMILAMMVLPLPPLALDLLFTFNIALSLMVMMVAATMKRPLDFAALPAVLLVTTLLRLSLNVA